MVTNLYRALTYGEEKLTMESYDSDHVIIRGHVSNVLFYKAYTTTIGRVVTYGDRKPCMESYDSLTTSHEKIRT